MYINLSRASFRGGQSQATTRTLMIGGEGNRQSTWLKLNSFFEDVIHRVAEKKSCSGLSDY